MKKIIPILIVGALVSSGIGAIASSEADETQVTQESIFLSTPMFKDMGEYISVELPEATSLLMKTGKPILPVITWTTTFELGTKIKGVEVTYDVEEYTLSKKILPAPSPVPLSATLASKKLSKKVSLDKEVYLNSKCYPAEPYTVQKSAGLKNGENVLYVNVRVNCQYSPATNILSVPNEINIRIEYQKPDVPFFTGTDEYDMLIIVPEEFTTNLQPLIDHKNTMGISTIVKTLEDIYAEYTEGRHDPEKIKLCIYDMKDTYNIKYVLLAGGRKAQKVEWYLPEFRNNNDDGWESGFASDLYYGDIWKTVENDTQVFEDWDSNENEIFGEYKGFSKDIMNFYPDVTVGRIPFHYAFELDIVVDKIIEYETGADDSWFKKGIMIAGDTFPNGNTYYEGEMETDHTGDLLEDDGFEIEKLWTSLDTMTGVPDVVKAISAGAGFVHFAGHGNPSTWSTHPPDDEDTWITGLSWTDMYKLRNREKLPFILVGGCHNAQFNATMGYILEGIRAVGIKEYFDMNGSDDGPDEDGTFGKFWLKEWVPRDFCSWLLLRKNGGAIGSIGMSGLGYGYVDQHAGAGLGGWIEPRMFDAYANQSIHIMGEAHDQAITDYINIIGNVNSGQIDRKTIEAFTLLGDPSLMLGGY